MDRLDKASVGERTEKLKYTKEKPKHVPMAIKALELRATNIIKEGGKVAKNLRRAYIASLILRVRSKNPKNYFVKLLYERFIVRRWDLSSKQIAVLEEMDRDY